MPTPLVSFAGFVTPSNTPLVYAPEAGMFVCVEDGTLMHAPIDACEGEDDIPDMLNYGDVEYWQCDHEQVTLAWAALLAAGVELPAPLVKDLLAAGVPAPAPLP